MTCSGDYFTALGFYRRKLFSFSIWNSEIILLYLITMVIAFTNSL